ncbi:MAG: HEPN domain-containing protein [Acidimicrobiales bacterium]
MAPQDDTGGGGPPLDGVELTRWRSEAGVALEGAHRDRSADSHAQACFRAEQAAQLAVKGLLRGVGSTAWGHDLVVLSERLRDAVGIELWPETLDGLARRLSLHYTTSRYPDTFPEGTPSQHYGPELSDQAIADSLAVVAAVDRAWEQLILAGDEE